MEELNVSRGKAEALYGVIHIKGTTRTYMQKRFNFGEAGLRETEKVNDGWLSGLIRIGLAIVHYYAREYEDSKEHSIVANRLFKECGTNMAKWLHRFG